MKNSITMLAVLMLLTAACRQSGNEMNTADNPFYREYQTPFQVPPFDQIEEEHFAPAFEKGIELHKQEIDAIIHQADPPDFENTIAALDRSGEQFNKVSNVFYNLLSANTNDTLQSIAEEVAPKISAYQDDIKLNPELFARVRSVYDHREELDLTAEEQTLLDKVYKQFVRGGAGLNEADKSKLREINQRLSVLTLKFGKNVLQETNNFQMVIEDEADLAGLPGGLINSAAEAARQKGLEGKWLFTIQRPVMYPFLQYSEKRELREKLHKAYYNRCNNDNEFDNKEILVEIANLRVEKARLLGYPTHAHYVLETNMAKTPEGVYELINPIWEAALSRAREEVKEMQAIIDREGGGFRLENWDWWYYAEKLRQEKYDFDEEALRPYFEVNAVREGIFEVVNRLWGLQFAAIENIPKPHPDVQAFEVMDLDGSHVGVLYMDFFTRPSKRGGAWMSAYRKQYMKDGDNVTPVITNVFNFAPPAAGKPALLTFDQVNTVYHEFGHALHGLLSNCEFRTLSGTDVPRDFVELPSQIMENWVAEPEVLKIFARHYETGEPIPDALIEKLNAASHWNQGFVNTEVLSATLLDMAWHTLEEPTTMDALAFENAALEEIGLIPEIIVRYRSPYFQHIFSGGYSAGYYSYTWSAVLDADAFEAFRETDLFNRQTAASFRKNILSRGGSEDPMVLYKRFRGREPVTEPLLRRTGLMQP